MSDELFRKGLSQARAGDIETARRLFSEVVKQDPNSEKGWFALANCMPNLEKKAYCFERVISINPDNQKAKDWLQRYNQERSSTGLEKIPEYRNNQEKSIPEEMKEPRKLPIAILIFVLLGICVGGIFIGGLFYFLVAPNPPEFISEVAQWMVPTPDMLGQPMQPTITHRENTLPPTWTPTPSLEPTIQPSITSTPLMNMSERLINNHAKVDQALHEMRSGHYAEAILIWDEVISVVPEYTDAYYQRGLCYLELTANQRYKSEMLSLLDQAYSDLNTAIELGPPKGDYYSKRVDVLDSLANLEDFWVDSYSYTKQAVDDLLQAYLLGHSYKWGNRSPGQYLVKIGRCEEALDFFLRLEKARGPDAEPSGTINWGIADCYICLNRYDKALPYAKRSHSIRMDENLPGVAQKVQLSEIYYALGRYSDALEMLNQLIETKPYYGGWRYYRRALMYYELGERELAEADIEFGSTQTWDQYRYRAFVKGLFALDDGYEDDALYWFQMAEATLRENQEPYIYQRAVEEIRKLDGETLFPTPTVTLEVLRTPIPVVSDNIFFTPTPPVPVLNPTMANFEGTGIYYFPLNTVRTFLFRSRGYPNLQDVKSLVVRIDGDDLGEGVVLKVALMKLDGSGYGEPIELTVGKNQIENPQQYVSAVGDFYILIENIAGKPIVVENISFQLQATDQNGSDLVLGFE